MHHSLHHVGKNCCQFFPDVLFQIHRCPWFLFVHLVFEISLDEEVLRLGTLSLRWILNCGRNILWVKTESLFSKIVSTVKTRCSTDQRSMVTEMLWVSLEECSRTNSPRQRFHIQLFCQIVRYFCRTLYIYIYIYIYINYTKKGKLHPLYRHWGSVQAVRPIGGVEV